MSNIIKQRRQNIQKALVVNATTKPVNMLIPAVTVAAGIGLGAPIILMLVLGLITWVAASAATFFDTEEAEKVGKEFRKVKSPKHSNLHPKVTHQLGQIDQAYQQLQSTIQQSQQSLPEIETEAEALKEMAYQSANKASMLLYLLDEQPRSQVQHSINNIQGNSATQVELKASLQKQLANLDKASQQVQDFVTQIQHLVSELQVVRSTIATSSSISDRLLSERLADESKILREKTEAMQDIF